MSSRSPKVAKIIYCLDEWLAGQVLNSHLSVEERKEFAREIRAYLGPLPEWCREPAPPAEALEDAATVGAGVPARTYTREKAQELASAVNFVRELNAAADPEALLRERMALLPVVHILTQEDQPYGSERRCCNRCGIWLGPDSAGQLPFYVLDWDDFNTLPNNCSKVKP